MDQDSIDARAMLERTPVGELDRKVYGEWVRTMRLGASWTDGFMPSGGGGG